MLDPSNPFYTDWYAAMNPQPMPMDPLAIAPPMGMPPMGEFATPELAPPPGVPTIAELPPAAAPAVAPTEAEIEMPAEYVGRAPAPIDPYAGPQLEVPPLPATGFELPTPEVDAISGVDATPPTGTETRMLGGELADPYPLRKSTAPGEESLSTEEYLALNPIQRARYEAEQDSKLADFAREQQAAIQKKDAELAEAEWRDYQDVKQGNDALMTKALADSDALANEKTKGFFDSAGNIFGSLLGIVLGAGGAPATGGRNAGVDGMNAAIERHGQQQREEYNRKAGAIDKRINIYGRLREQGYSDYQAQTVFRMAALGRARAQLITNMQQFAPHGTTARNIGKHILATEGQIAQSAEAMRRQNLDEELRLRKDQRETLESKAKLAESDAKLKKLRGTGSGVGTVKPGNLSAAEVQAMLPPGSARVPERPGGYTAAQAMGHVALFKASREVKSFEDDQQRKETAEVRELGVGGPSGEALTNKDKSDFKARNAAVAEKLTKQANAAREVADIIDEVLAIRERSGGEAKIWNSDDRARLDVLQDRIVILEKGGTEGMSSEEDMKKLASAVGASDVASFRSRTAGLKKGRERTVAFLNQTLRSNQYTGDAVKVPNRFNLPKPKPTEREEDLQTIVKSDVDAATADKAAAVLGKNVVDPLSEDAPENINALFEKVVRRARSGDAAAWKDLETIRDTAVSPSIKSRADAVLVERPK